MTYRTARSEGELRALLSDLDGFLAELPEGDAGTSNSRLGDGSIHPYRRPLLPAEKYVDLAAIDKGFDQGKNDLLAAVKPIQAAQIAELMQLAVRYAAAGKPIDVEEIKVPLRDEMRMAIYQVLKEQYRSGRAQVQSEIEKQRGARLVAEHIPEQPEGKILSLFREKSQGLTSIFSVRLKASLATILNLYLGDREFDPESVTRDLVKTAETDVKRNAGEAITDAVNVGRTKEAIEQRMQIGIYSALLDATCCDQCAAADGKEFVVGSAEYWAHLPPYQACDWPPNCRCTYVFEAGEAYWRNRVLA